MSTEFKEIGQTIRMYQKIDQGDLYTDVYNGEFNLNGVWTRCALKRVSLNSEEHHGRVKQEIEILKNLKHDNIVKYYGTEKLNTNRVMIFIALELCDASMKHYVEPEPTHMELQEKFAIYLTRSSDKYQVLQQIVSGLAYLHSDKLNKEIIIHRDLKPKNILFKVDESNKRIKAIIIDLGLSKLIQEDASFSNSAIIGTEGWMAPEQSLDKHVRTSTDIFSLGLIFYYFLTNGIHPFDDHSNKSGNRGTTRQENIDKEEKYEAKIKMLRPDALEGNLACFNLIKSMLKRTPDERPASVSMENHPVFYEQQHVDEEAFHIDDPLSKLVKLFGKWYVYLLIDGSKLESYDNCSFDQFFESVFFLGTDVYDDEEDTIYELLKKVNASYKMYKRDRKLVESSAFQKDSRIKPFCESWIKGHPIYIVKPYDYLQEINAKFKSKLLQNLLGHTKIYKDDTSEVEEVYSNLTDKNKKGLGMDMLKKIHQIFIKAPTNVITEQNVDSFLENQSNGSRTSLPIYPSSCSLCKLRIGRKDRIKNLIEHLRTNCNQIWTCQLCDNFQSSNLISYKNHLYQESDKLGREAVVEKLMPDCIKKLKNDEEPINLKQYCDNIRILRPNLGTSYIYMLLDGRFITKDNVSVYDFISSIFYISCSQSNDLPFKEIINTVLDNNLEASEYFCVSQKIREIFKNNSFVGILKPFDYETSEMVNHKIHSIVKTLGLNFLDNLFIPSCKSLDWKNFSSELSKKDFGQALLFHAFQHIDKIIKISYKDVSVLIKEFPDYDNKDADLRTSTYSSTSDEEDSELESE